MMWTLGQNLGTSIGKAELEFCLTVPSDWSEISRQKYLKDFQRSLKSAGLNINAPLSLVTESVSDPCYIFGSTKKVIRKQLHIMLSKDSMIYSRVILSFCVMLVGKE
jgi:hypothetical protein